MRWPTSTLGDVCEIVSGATPKTGNPVFWDGDVPWVTPKDLSAIEQKHISDTPRKITDAGLRSCSANMLPANSVLFSSRAPIGLVAINAIPVCTNQGFKSMVPRTGRISSDYLYWWLKTHQKSLQRMGRGATFKEVSKKIVEAIQIPLPPLAEQRRIAGILDGADALRAKRRESLQQLDSLIQSTFLEMFGDPVTNPMGWEAAALGNLCALVNGRAFKPDEWEESGVPIIRIQNLNDESKPFNYTSKALPEQFRAKPGDILLSWSGTPGTSFGCFRWNGPEGWVNQHIFLVTVDSGMDSTFFIHSVNARLMELIANAHGGVGLKHITKKKLEAVRLALPPLDLQRRFAKIVELVECQKVRMRAHLEELDTLFASLQQRAFRGDL